MHNFGGNTNLSPYILSVFKQKQTNHCIGPIIGQFLSSTFFLTCLESAKCNKTFQSKRTKEARSYGFKVPCLAIQEKYTSRQTRHSNPSLRNLFGFTLQLQTLAFKRFLRKQASVCMYDQERGSEFAYLGIKNFRDKLMK